MKKKYIKKYKELFNSGISNYIESIKLLKKKTTLFNKIIFTADKIYNLKKNKNKIIIFGNGGSAAESQHFSAELVGRFLKNRYPVPSICLNTDTSAITAIANDFGYKKVFSRQVNSIANPNDIVFAISTSGKSSNIISGLLEARKLNCHSILLTGKKSSKNADTVINVPAKRVDRIQELHLFIIHFICQLVEEKITENQKKTSHHHLS